MKPVKVDLLSGLAVRVTTVPRANCALQLAPQLMLVPLTEPEPVPALVTVRDETPTLAAAICVRDVVAQLAIERSGAQAVSPAQGLLIERIERTGILVELVFADNGFGALTQLGFTMQEPLLALCGLN